MRHQEETMFAAGFLPAAEVAEILGWAHVGSVHRAAKLGYLRAQRVGVHWFVSAYSVLNYNPASDPNKALERKRVEAALGKVGVPIKKEDPCIPVGTASSTKLLPAAKKRTKRKASA